jgi:hypothetical protein
MRLLWIMPALLAGVAGCAGQQQVRARDVASIDLCRYMLRGGHDAAVAEAEASRRGFDCKPYMRTLMEQDAYQRAAAANALANAARAFQQPIYPLQPLPAQPQPIHCQSYMAGQTQYTNCR